MNPVDFTNFNPLGIVIIGLFGVMTLLLPRKYAIVPVLVGTCYVGLGQVIDVFGFHFTSMRLLMLVGFVRVIVKQEMEFIFLENKIDKALIVFVFISLAIYMILWQTQKAIIYKLGIVYNVFGLYLLCRLLVRDIDEVVGIIRLMLFATIPIALFMILEKFTGKNLFSYFGSVRPYTMIREGRLRCQGPFTHPILAGTFGVTFAPMFLGLWFKGEKDRILAVIGVISTTLITFLCASSGPAIAYACFVIGVCCWYIKDHMRTLRWSILLMLIFLQLIMKSPVYSLIGRLSNITGGTGWHRVYLIDSAIKYFGDWWMIGTRITAHWMPYVLPIDPNNVDITNQYILVGIEGGIVSVILFLYLLVQCFSSVGSSTRYYANQSSWLEKFVWSLGVSLFTYVVSFISVSMFDFMEIYFYMLVSFISIACVHEVNNDTEIVSESSDYRAWYN
jgi:hypothetical protein